MPITEEELDQLFGWNITTNVDPITYRKYTTDVIPEYSVTLNNYSSDIPIRVYASSSAYLSVVDATNNRQITTTSFITLNPLSETEVLVVFNPSQIDESTDTDINLSFIVQALELGQSAPTPTTPTGPTGNAGGGGNTNPEEDDSSPTVTPPSDGPNQT
jgi:hypothetical protein